jgi:UDP-GlcNAc:undecaprenyl-phosphate/decaprenyl-phosphate GlcNAc-1-phosphate transferase
MSLELKALVAVAVAAAVAVLVTPLMARLAAFIGLLDRPVGYKQHERPTPYLGGVAILLGVVAAALAVQGVTSRLTVVLLAASAMCALGTIDDWRPMAPGPRLAVQAIIGAAIWAGDAGWATPAPASVDLLMTIGWVVLAVNTLNLLDNLDGAAASVAAASALGVAVIALATGGLAWAPIVAAGVVGACLGFLPFNLARPARVFLGDGGSTVIGFLIAVSAMGALNGESSNSVYLAAGLLIAVPLLDTALVFISRHRRGVPMLSGGRDHLTHRVYARVHDARKVAIELAALQATLSAIALLAVLLGPMAVVIATACYAIAAAAAITALETTYGAPSAPAASSPAPAERGTIPATMPASGVRPR